MMVVLLQFIEPVYYLRLYLIRLTISIPWNQQFNLFLPRISFILPEYDWQIKSKNFYLRINNYNKKCLEECGFSVVYLYHNLVDSFFLLSELYLKNKQANVEDRNVEETYSRKKRKGEIEACIWLVTNSRNICLK